MKRLKQVLISLFFFCGIPTGLFANIDIRFTSFYNEGSCQGFISVNIEGNAGPFTITIYDLSYSDQNPIVIKNIDNGNYVDDFGQSDYMVKVENSFGCIKEETGTIFCDCNMFIDEPRHIINPTSCLSDNGSIYHTGPPLIIGGTNPYSYEWSNGYTSDNFGIFELSEGTYIVTVTDYFGCTATRTFNLVPDDFPAIYIDIDRPCPETSNGNLYVAMVTENLEYEWNYDNYVVHDDGFDLENIPMGEYCLSFIDTETMCSKDFCISVVDIPPCDDFNFDFDNILIGTSCFEQPTGFIYLPVLGGNPFSASELSCEGHYKYSWSTGSSDKIELQNIYAGIYSVTVEDKCGRIIEGSYEVPSYDEIIIDATPYIGCPGLGSLSIEASGGTPPFSYIWSNGKTTQNIFGLNQGNYTVTVTDSNNCFSTSTTFVPNYPSMDLSIEKTDYCYNSWVPFDPNTIFNEGLYNSGEVRLLFNNETLGPYTIEWSDGTTYQIDSPENQIIGGIEMDGDYKVTVTDGNGCKKVKSISIENSFEFVESDTQCHVDFFCGSSSDPTNKVSSIGGEYINCLWSSCTEEWCDCELTGNVRFFTHPYESIDTTTECIIIGECPNENTFYSDEVIEDGDPYSIQEGVLIDCSTSSPLTFDNCCFGCKITEGCEFNGGSTITMTGIGLIDNAFFDTCGSTIKVDITCGSTVTPICFEQDSTCNYVVDCPSCFWGGGDGTIDTRTILKKDKSRIKVYPNPARGFLNIEIFNQGDIPSISIIGINGKSIINNITIEEKNDFIDVSILIPGVYFIKAKFEQGVDFIKFVKL